MSTVVGVAAPAFAESKPRVFRADDSSISVKKGKQFVVVLEGNPTTGYEWTLEGRSKLAKLDGHRFKSSSKLPGAGGEYRFTFLARRRGTDTLEFRYARPFMPNDPQARTQSFELTVR